MKQEMLIMVKMRVKKLFVQFMHKKRYVRCFIYNTLSIESCTCLLVSMFYLYVILHPRQSTLLVKTCTVNCIKQ